MPNLPPPGSRACLSVFAALSSAARAAIAACLTLALIGAGASPTHAEIPPIARVLPPEGIEIPAEVRERLETRLAALKKRLAALPNRETSFEFGGPRIFIPRDVANIEIFTKAVELALRHREFYSLRDFTKADWALEQAEQRLASLEDYKWPWHRATGLVVRGYRSTIDDSVQSYGLVIPEGHDFTKPCPLYVWLHGRGDKQTDLHFLYERATKVGQIAPPGAIVLHPFGRHCVGFKHAGEIDVLEATADVRRQYKTHEPILIGFSMGGAGAWHLGAHYPNNWVAVAPGAGFAETARYQRLSPDRYPPWYEQKLWQAYDVPGYVRNLFNTEVIAYSGELDKQIQAARVMEEAYRAEGRELTHLIGPGVEHKYEPKTLENLLARLEKIADKGREEVPRQVHWQSPTLNYNYAGWITVITLEEHWKDSRVDAEIAGPAEIRMTTKNVAGLFLHPEVFGEAREWRVVVDGQNVAISVDPNPDKPLIHELRKRDGKWRFAAVSLAELTDDRDWKSKRTKRPGVTGPIDDCFTDSFVVVTPTGKSRNAAFQAWVDFELAHFRDRWRSLMRAELPEIRDVDYDPEKVSHKNLVLWGDFDSNKLLARMAEPFDLPVKFRDGNWMFGEQTYDGDRFVPVMVYPQPLPNRMGTYVVLNSGLTFREGHDHTNSLQNPKLPDWAIIDLSQPPDAFAPGRIHDAGFFDENWQLKGPPKGP
jgi:pimeloyl-ACP methyl ester carboxylesterase